MFAHRNCDNKVRPPEVGPEGQLILDAGTRQAEARAYNEGVISTLANAAQPSVPHFLGRTASLPDGGLTVYMAACFAQAMYRINPLSSIGEAVKLKNGASIAFLIPPREGGDDTEAATENNDRMMEQIMDETAEYLIKLKSKCTANQHVDTYADIMGLLGNMYLQQEVNFNAMT